MFVHIVFTKGAKMVMVATLNNIRHTFVAGIQTVVENAKMLVVKTDGLDKINKLALAILNPILRLLPEGIVLSKLKVVVVNLNSFKELISGTNVVNRIDDWFGEKKKNTKPWSNLKIASNIALTIGHVLESIMYLEYLSVLKLGRISADFVARIPTFTSLMKIATPISLFKDAAIAVSATLSLIDSKKKMDANKEAIESIDKKVTKCSLKEASFKQFGKQSSNEHDKKLLESMLLIYENKFLKWKQKSNDPKASKQMEKYSQYITEALEGKFTLALEKISQKKTHYEVIIQDKKIDNNKVKWSIAYNIGKIALITLGFFAQYNGYDKCVLGILALAGLGLIHNTIGVIKYLYDEHHPEKTNPPGIPC